MYTYPSDNRHHALIRYDMLDPNQPQHIIHQLYFFFILQFSLCTPTLRTFYSEECLLDLTSRDLKGGNCDEKLNEDILYLLRACAVWTYSSNNRGCRNVKQREYGQAWSDDCLWANALWHHAYNLMRHVPYHIHTPRTELAELWTGCDLCMSL